MVMVILGAPSAVPERMAGHLCGGEGGQRRRLLNGIPDSPPLSLLPCGYRSVFANPESARSGHRHEYFATSGPQQATQPASSPQEARGCGRQVRSLPSQLVAHIRRNDRQYAPTSLPGSRPRGEEKTGNPLQTGNNHRCCPAMRQERANLRDLGSVSYRALVVRFSFRHRDAMRSISNPVAKALGFSNPMLLLGVGDLLP